MLGFKPFVVIGILLMALLVACGPTEGEPGIDEPAETPISEPTQSPTEMPTAETPATEGPAEAVTAAAIARLAQELGLADETAIEVVSAEMTEFSDSCLGLGGPAESCLQAITPGWVIVLSVEGQEYEVRTDETGQQARVALEPATDGAADSIAAAVQEFLAGELGVVINDVEVLSVEPAEFSDSCLGLGGANESCLQVITPGWLVMVNVQGQEHEVHTDQTGQQIRVADQSE
jgi:hypothetical protein